MSGRGTTELVDRLFREKAGQMVASLTRILGPSRHDLAEEVVQESLLAALRSWPFDGIPENPGGWLFRTAKNRAIDRVRHEAMARERLATIVREIEVLPDRDDEPRFACEIRDDQLAMMFMCCAPTMPRDARIALTLKMVSGFGVDEIARAFLSRREAIQQRIVRAKKVLREEVELRMPPPAEIRSRVDAVLDVLYLMFNEGYHASEGDAPVRLELCREAIRLGQLMAEHPAASSPKVHALLSLMQLHASRLPARVATEDLVLLDRQDRSLWDRAMIARGLASLDAAARGDEMTAFHVEAAIAACHAVAPAWEATDWARLVSLYDDLQALKPTPVIRINRAIALSKVEGPVAALAELTEVAADPAVAGYLPLHAALGELRLATGDRDGAAGSFRQAAALTRSSVVRRFFEERAGRAGGFL